MCVFKIRAVDKDDGLTSCVFQPADGIRKQSYAAQKTCPLSFMDLLVVPYTDGDGVCFTNVAKKTKQVTSATGLFNPAFYKGEPF